MAEPRKLGFVGAGNMAEAIGRGVLSAKLFGPKDLLASDPAAGRRALFTEQLGVEAIDSNSDLVERCETVLLAVKPQVMGDVLAGLAGHLAADKLVISIAAGISTAYIGNALGEPPRRIVRVMPNTPMLAGEGMSVLAAGAAATDEDLAFVRRIFESAGRALVVDESLIDAVTAVSGSGPAYFFYFVEAIVAGGVRAGLTEADATTLAQQTMLGAAKLLAQTGEAPAELRRKVTSPGGTTEAAIASMDAAQVRSCIADGVVAAAERSRQLGK
ncbi:MAG TPA: pyrroline-5-carboxylate reductase [Phycisphaerae bacterium]|nr:pyrroline-5-carboxylate reductase [Phycisphaerae bacterium]